MGRITLPSHAPALFIAEELPESEEPQQEAELVGPEQPQDRALPWAEAVCPEAEEAAG